MRFCVCAAALVCSVVLVGCSSDDSSSGDGGSDASTASDTSSSTDSGKTDSGTDSASASDTSTGHDAAFDAGCAKPGTAAFGTICGGDCDCASTACLFGGQGSYCSIRCGTAQDCPTPMTSGNCNGQGFCTK